MTLLLNFFTFLIQLQKQELTVLLGFFFLYYFLFFFLNQGSKVYT